MKIKLHLLYRADHQEEEELGHIVADVYVPVIPPPGAMLSVTLYEDVGKEKLGIFRVLDQAQYYLTNHRQIFPYLSLSRTNETIIEASIHVEPTDEETARWVNNVIDYEATAWQRALQFLEERSVEPIVPPEISLEDRIGMYRAQRLISLRQMRELMLFREQLLTAFMRERYPQVHYEIEVGLDAVTLRLVEAIPEQVAQINGEIRACLDEIDALAVEQFKLELAEDGDA